MLAWLLLLLALGVLTAVLIYNLRERRRLPRATMTPAEPTLDSQFAPASPSAPVQAEELPEFAPPFMVSVRLADAMDGERAADFLQAARSIVRAGNKSAAVRITRGEREQGQEVVCGLVLANRLGPLTLPDYDAWVQQIDVLSDLLDLPAPPPIPSFAELHALSREAERRLAALDGQMVLHVLAPPPTDRVLHEWAMERGLSQRAGRHYSRMVSNDQVGYTFSPGDGGRAVSCILDLPRTPDPEQSYRLMIQDLFAAADAFSGSVVDESSRTLVEEDLSIIERQLAARAEELRAAGISPGSWLAKAIYV
jgi:hypothetical protein